MDQKEMDPLHGYCLCDAHVGGIGRGNPGEVFLFLQATFRQHLLCGGCAPEQATHGGLSLKNLLLKAW
jgi:hypothetical protein